MKQGSVSAMGEPLLHTFLPGNNPALVNVFKKQPHAWEVVAQIFSKCFVRCVRGQRQERGYATSFTPLVSLPYISVHRNLHQFKFVVVFVLLLPSVFVVIPSLSPVLPLSWLLSSIQICHGERFLELTHVISSVCSHQESGSKTAFLLEKKPGLEKAAALLFPVFLMPRFLWLVKARHCF